MASPLVVARAILMDVVPDPNECVDLRATGAMLEYNGATALCEECTHQPPALQIPELGHRFLSEGDEIAFVDSSGVDRA
jgi:hypothetical protein